MQTCRTFAQRTATVSPRPLRVAYGIGAAMLVVLLGSCALQQAGPPSPAVASQAKEDVPKPEEPKVEQVGNASWYGPAQDGKETASGETFDQNALTAAHPTLPLGTTAVVTNLETGKSVEVTINDRGPYAKGRKIDLSRAAAQRIGMTKKGVTRVRIVATPHQKLAKHAVSNTTKSGTTPVAAGADIPTPSSQ
jgi:rare lipoprotein A